MTSTNASNSLIEAFTLLLLTVTNHALLACKLPGTSIDALGVKSQAMAQEACAAAEAAQNAAASAISALTSALEAQSRELQAFASKQDEAMKSALASVSQLSQGATTGLQGAQLGIPLRWNKLPGLSRTCGSEEHANCLRS